MLSKKRHENLNLRAEQALLLHDWSGHTVETDVDGGGRAKYALLTFCGHRGVGKSFGLSLDHMKTASEWVQEKTEFILRGDVTNRWSTYSYLCPTVKMSRDIILKYWVDHLLRFNDAKINRNTMEAIIPRPALKDEVKFQAFASRTYDRIRGGTFRKADIDEFQDTPPDALSYALSPAVGRTGGLIKAIGTADAGGHFFTHVKRQIEAETPCFVIPASKTKIFTKDELLAKKHEIGHDAYMREYECDFSVALGGAFFSARLKELGGDPGFYSARFDERNVRVMGVDIGVGRGFCSWVAEVGDPRRLEVKDFFEGYDAVNEMRMDLEAAGCLPDVIYVPHDSETKRPGAFKADTMKQNFKKIFPECLIRTVRKTSDRMKTIEMVQQNLHILAFPPRDTKGTDVFIGLSKLKRYKKQRNLLTGHYTDQIERNGTEHAADALRTIFQGVRVRGGKMTSVPTFKVGQRPETRPVYSDLWAKGNLINIPRPGTLGRPLQGQVPSAFDLVTILK